MKEMEEKEVIC